MGFWWGLVDEMKEAAMQELKVTKGDGAADISLGVGGGEQAWAWNHCRLCELLAKGRVMATERE